MGTSQHPHTVRRAASLITVLIAMTAGPFTSASAAAPVNDDFADAIEFSLTDPSPLYGSNIDATGEIGEPNHNWKGFDAATSVWWQFAPTARGDVTFSLEGSTFDAVLGVYTGSTLSDLEVVRWYVKGDEETPITVEAGTTYHVAVSGEAYGDSEGDIVLGFAWTETGPVGTIVIESPLGTAASGLDFGTVAPGSGSSRTVFVRNTGDGPLTVDTVTLSSRSFASGEYRIVSDTASGGPIPPGEYRQLVLAFEPKSGPTGSPDAVDYLGALPGQPILSTYTYYDSGTGQPSLIEVYTYFRNAGGSGDADYTAVASSGGAVRGQAQGTTALVGGDAYSMMTRVTVSGTTTSEPQLEVTLPVDFSATRVFRPVPPAISVPDFTGVSGVSFARLADAMLVIQSDDPETTQYEPTGTFIPLYGHGSDGAPSAGDVSRWAGADRFATAAAVSASAFPGGADVAFVATGANFPDALAGGPAGGVLGGPILLTDRDTIPQATLDELRRLGPSQVVILGGAAVVTDNVATQLADALG
jgi:hypothetical protein